MAALDETLEDVAIRQRQLESHLLQSPEYLRRADQELKRQVSELYLAIALLLIFQGLFAGHAFGLLPASAAILTILTSFLAIINCLLLIRTKSFLHRLNEAWLKPEEKSAIGALRSQRDELLARATPKEKIEAGISGTPAIEH
jgi:hypothetical protein